MQEPLMVATEVVRYGAASAEFRPLISGFGCRRQ